MRIVVLRTAATAAPSTRGGARPPEDDWTPKQLPLDVAIATERPTRRTTRSSRQEIPSKRLTTVAATVVLISGCQDDRFGNDGRERGCSPERS